MVGKADRVRAAPRPAAAQRRQLDPRAPAPLAEPFGAAHVGGDVREQIAEIQATLTEVDDLLRERLAPLDVASGTSCWWSCRTGRHRAQQRRADGAAIERPDDEALNRRPAGARRP